MREIRFNVHRNEVYTPHFTKGRAVLHFPKFPQDKRSKMLGISCGVLLTAGRVGGRRLSCSKMIRVGSRRFPKEERLMDGFNYEALYSPYNRTN